MKGCHGWREAIDERLLLAGNGRVTLPRLPTLNLSLLCHLKCIVDFNAQIPDGALQLGVAQQ